MQAAITALGVLGAVNGSILKLGRAIGIVAVALMVVAILIQVFFRYVLNNALPWPDEAARFCMMWMTGLMAPSAFRAGGFVAIDMVVAALPRMVGAFISLGLLFISALVLYTAVQIGLKEVSGIGGKFGSAALYVPFAPLGICDGSLGLKVTGDTSWCRVPRSWMMLSLLVGVILLLWVNIELILRAIVGLLGHGDELPPIANAEVAD
ncbi:MAG: TRAP transporter small permease [Paracoccaceae bacterium]